VAGYWPLVGLLRAGAPATDLVAHLPTALAALGVLFLTFRMARRIAGVEAGWVAVVVLQCTVGFLGLNWRVLVDPLLCLWVTLALHGALFAVSDPEQRGRHLAVFYAAMGAAVLTKGLVGLALPAAVALVFLAVSRQLVLLPRIVFHPALLAFVAPIAAWLLGLAAAEGTPALGEVWRQSITRALSSGADHAAPPWFYLEPVAYLTLPGLLIVPYVVRDVLCPRAHRRVRLHGPFDLFGPVWFATMLGVLSLASAKRNIYLGPIYPGLALALATWWARARQQAPDARTPRWLSAAVAARPRAQASALLAFAMLYLAFNVAVESPASRANAPSRIFALATAAQSRNQGSQVLFAGVPRESLAGAAVYYLGRTVPMVDSLDQLDALSSRRVSVLVGTDRAVDPMLRTLAYGRLAGLRTSTLGRDDYRIATVRPPDVAQVSTESRTEPRSRSTSRQTGELSGASDLREGG
jgi:4-amino-4-deoxy-L-arabinose transferase-like glycosyltransferase